MDSRIPFRVAARHFRRLYAEYIGRMTRERALSVLGLEGHPSEEEVNKAWKKRMWDNHPDRGGTNDRAVEINVSRDFLLGVGTANRERFRPEPPPPTPKREPPKPPPVVDTIKGIPFHEAAHVVPGGVEWLFISNTVWSTKNQECRAVFGRTSSHLVVVGFLHTNARQVYDHAKGGVINQEESWEAKVTEAPLTRDLVKTAPQMVKTVLGPFGVPRMPVKYSAWPGGSIEQSVIETYKASGGVHLKDMLAHYNLVSKEHESIKGRKSTVEIVPKGNLDKYRKLKAVRKVVYTWESSDYYVSINGQHPEKLADETVEKLGKNGFVLSVFSYNPEDGVRRNLTKMRIPPDRTLQLLLEALTTESSAFVEALTQALEEWRSSTKSASGYDRRPA